MSHQALALVCKEVERGNVSERVSNGSLSLFKYTTQCTHRRSWNKTNLRCRGIVFDTITGKIICRPFDKFFNLGERPSTKPKYVLSRAKKTAFRVTEKMDGSMLCIWHCGDKWMTSTPGSIDSPQAIYARDYLLSKYNINQLPTDITYVCEMISPTDRQDKVVDYGKRDELVLLTAFENRWEQTEVPAGRLSLLASRANMPKVPVWEADFENFMSLPIPDNVEGYVIAFEDGFRIKVKSMAYVKAFRLLSDFSSKHLFEYVREGSYREAVRHLPESKRRYFDDLYAKILQVKGNIELEVEKWLKICDPNDMKKSAEVLKDAGPIKSLVFGALRNKDVRKVLWKLTEEEVVRSGHLVNQTTIEGLEEDITENE